MVETISKRDDENLDCTTTYSIQKKHLLLDRKMIEDHILMLTNDLNQINSKLELFNKEVIK